MTPRGRSVEIHAAAPTVHFARELFETMSDIGGIDKTTCAFRHSTQRGKASRAVRICADRPSMDEALLLSDRGMWRHNNLY